jgi:hypothetical protein
MWSRQGTAVTTSCRMKQLRRDNGGNCVSGSKRGWVVFSSVILVSSSGYALDKQGSAHGGQVGDDGDSGFNVAGALTLGSSIYNPTYAARPDNTGLALMRYAAHADIDLLGRKLSLPIDVNMFTDRLRSGLDVFAPTELDIIAGVTTTWTLGPGAFELGSRFENDRPVDGTSTFTQSYVDVRARYLYSLAGDWDALAKRKADISGWATLGVFAWNPTYAARPDNSGHALFRYGLHAELSLFDDLLSFGMDGAMFTDRDANVVEPSELDLTPEVILHYAPFELHLAYERDLPLTGPSDYSQTYAYALVAWSFDFKNSAEKPLESRGQILSP